MALLAILCPLQVRDRVSCCRVASLVIFAEGLVSFLMIEAVGLTDVFLCLSVFVLGPDP